MKAEAEKNKQDKTENQRKKLNPETGSVEILSVNGTP